MFNCISATRAAFAGAAVAASLAFAGPAAASVTVQDAMFFDAYAGGQTDSRSYVVMSPFIVNVQDGADLFSTLAFCIQLNIDMPVDAYSGAPTTLNTPYSDVVLGLSAGDQSLLGQLVNYGTGLYLGGTLSTADLSVELAAIQGAIWTITSGETVKFFHPSYDDPGTPGVDEADALDLKIVDYLNGVGLSGTPASVRTLYSGLDVTGAPLAQGIAFAGTAPVPEPATWAMMIVGFASLGSALRLTRRRALAQA